MFLARDIKQRTQSNSKLIMEWCNEDSDEIDRPVIFEETQ